MLRPFACDCCLALRVAGLIVLGVLCIGMVNVSRVVRVYTGEAAEMMSSFSNSEVPDALRGVFWMEGNTAPEVLMNYEVVAFDPAERRFDFNWGAPYGWSYNADTLGWLEYVASTTFCGAGLHIARVSFIFNEDYTLARLPFYMFGVQTGEWALRLQGGNMWTRGTLDERGDFVPAYTLRRVIDQDGEKLPSFEKLVWAAQRGIPVNAIPNLPHFASGSMAGKAKTDEELLLGPVGLKTVLMSILTFVLWAACVCACFLCHAQRGDELDGAARLMPLVGE